MLKKLWLSLFVAFFVLSVNTVYAADRININTATQSQLETLQGVGPATAKAIIDYREQVGEFETVADVINVKGIGDKKLAQISEQLIVTDPKSTK